MKPGRWVAVLSCSVMVGASVALLSLVLNRTIDRGDPLRFAPVIALTLLALAPFVAAIASGRSLPYVGGAGGLAIGIAVALAAAALDQGGTGAFALTTSVAVAGALALRGSARAYVGRVPTIALLAVYSYFSGRLISAAFVYPLLGIADELVDAFTRDGATPPDTAARVTTSQS